MAQNRNINQTILVDGSVGIGETSPSTKLYIKNTAGDADITLQGSSQTMRIDQNSIKTTTASQIAIFTNNTTTNGIYISSTGNVGIGTTSPATTLQVNGIARATRLNSTGGVVDFDAQTGNNFIQISSGEVSIANAGNVNMTITSGGNVGIGETSVDAKLHITSIGAVVNQKFEINGVAAWRMGIPNGQTYFAFDNSADALTSPKMVINSSGNVGIGTTSPADKLVVVGNISIGSSYKLYNGSANDSAGITFPGSTTRIDGFNGITFHASSTNVGSQTERMRITSGGNVGIGTTSPGYNLHTYGSNPRNLVQDSGTGYPIFQLTNNSGSFYMSIDNSTGSGFGSAYARYLYSAGAYPMIFVTNGAERLRIDSAGNVGIGTAAPGSQLHVSSSSTSSTSILVGNTSTGSSRIYFDAQNGDFAGNDYGYIGQADYGYMEYNVGTSSPAPYHVFSNGNVGIGTTSPDQKLHIIGTSSDTAGTGLLAIEGGGGNVSWVFRSTATGDNLAIDREYGGAGVYYNTLTLQRSTGNVGIGTTSPATTLHIAAYSANLTIQDSNSSGNTSTARILFTDNGTFGTIGTIGFSGDDDLYIQNNHTGNILLSGGNVGIGTVAPTSKLEVSGSTLTELKVTETSGSVTAMVQASSTYGWVGTKTNHTMYIGSNDGAKITILTSGNVGIGTTSPSRTLDVNGEIQNNGIFRKSGIVIIKSTGSETMIGPGGSGVVSFHNNSTMTTSDETMRITSTGNVGIGTTSPNNELEILGSNSPRISLRSSNEAVGEALELGFQVGTGANASSNTVGLIKSVITQADPSTLIGDLEFQTNSGDSASTKMIIKGSGNVGIGTTSPSTKLHVIGTNNDAVLRIVRGNATYQYLDIRGYEIQSRGNNLLLTADTNQEVWIGNSTNNKYLLVNAVGNVGIGTTSPDSKLNIISGAKGIHVDKGSYSSTAANLSECRTIYAFAYDTLRNGSTTGFFITNVSTNVPAMQAVDSSNNAQNISIQPFGGNVGIGTTSPSTLLHLSAANPEIRITDTSNTNYNSIRNVDGNFWIEADKGNELGNSRIRFTVDSTEYMTINTGGNVGIGTTAPAGPLHVKYSSSTLAGITIENDGIGYNAGSLTLRSGTSGGMNMSVTSGGGMYWYSLSNSSNALSLTSSNNLIINGATDNGKKLQVNGDVFIKGSNSSSTYANAIFEVQNSNGTSIMDFRGDAYAFFGCGQGGGAASGFIFRYNDTSHVQFTGYNYGNGAGSYKPILLDTDLVGRGQGIYVNFGGTGYANPAPLSSTEFAVRGRTSDATQNVMELRDSNNTEKFVVKNDGSIVTDGSQGWTGTVAIPNNPPGSQNLEFKNGILINVF